MLQVYLSQDLGDIKKEDLAHYYDTKIVSHGIDTRALVVTCTSQTYSRVFEREDEDQWIIDDPIDARNMMMVAPKSFSNSVHNLKVRLGMSGSSCAGLGSCTCLD